MLKMTLAMMMIKVDDDINDTSCNILSPASMYLAACSLWNKEKEKCHNFLAYFMGK